MYMGILLFLLCNVLIDNDDHSHTFTHFFRNNWLNDSKAYVHVNTYILPLVLYLSYEGSYSSLAEIKLNH